MLLLLSHPISRNIVGIVATNNGHTCLEHRFGCGNVPLSGRAGHGCRVLLQLQMTAPNELAAYMVSDDGSDRIRVGFAPRKNMVGVRECSLEEVYTTEHPNSHYCALYHVTVDMPLLRLLTRQKQAKYYF